MAITVGENNKLTKNLKEKNLAIGAPGSLEPNTCTCCAHARERAEKPKLSLLTHFEVLNKQEVKTKVEFKLPAYALKAHPNTQRVP